MSSNLLKMGMIASTGNEKRIIDTNALIAERIGSLKDEITQPANEGFTSGLHVEEVDVSALVADYDHSGEIPEIMEEPETDDPENAEDRAKEILQDAKDAAGRILQDAISQGEEEAAKLRESAMEEGYNAGAAKAQEEYDRKLQELNRKEQEMEKRIQDLEAQYDARLAELEPKFIDTLTGIYEHLFHVDFSGYRDVLLALIRDCLSGTENGRNFQIHVSKEDYTYVNTKKPLLLEAAGAGNISMEIIEDPSLHRNDCIIRTEFGIMDCGLDTQLEELAKRLKILAYEKK